MSLQLFGHPFSSYTWKVLIALWADETPFDEAAACAIALADLSMARTCPSH